MEAASRPNSPNPANPVNQFRRRAYRHAVEDGAIDLVVGVFTLVMGVATQRHVFLSLAVVYFGAMALAWRPLHDRLTSGRTGFAELKETPAVPLLGAVMLAGMLTMAVVAGFTVSTGRLWNLDGWPTWVPPIAGLTLASAFLRTGRQSGVARFYVFAALSVAGSVFFWLFPFGPRINPSDRLTLFLFAMAGVLMAVGAVTMAVFVRSKPVVPDEASNVR